MVTPALIAMLAAVGLAAAFAALAGASPAGAVAALVQGSLGSTSNVVDTLVRTTPLLLTGLGVMLAFRSGIFNIGADGQFLFGALAATAAATKLGPFRGQAVVVLLVGAAAGAIWAAVPAAFRLGRGVSEVITTILLNFVALYLVSFAVTGPLQEPSGAYPQSAAIAGTAKLWRVPGLDRLHIGAPLAFAVGLGVGGLLARTRLGLRLRAGGLNAAAARLAGFPVRADVALAFGLSGGLAGLAGAVELTGVTGRLYDHFSPGYGYTAIAVALLGGLRTGGVMAAALFFAALGAGANAMERTAGVSSVLAVAVQGTTLLAVAIAGRLGAQARVKSEKNQEFVGGGRL